MEHMYTNYISRVATKSFTSVTCQSERWCCVAQHECTAKLTDAEHGFLTSYNTERRIQKTTTPPPTPPLPTCCVRQAYDIIAPQLALMRSMQHEIIQLSTSASSEHTTISRAMHGNVEVCRGVSYSRGRPLTSRVRHVR